MSKVVKVSDGAYQLIADVASRHQIYLIDALDNILFKEGNPIEEEEVDDDGTVQVASNLVEVDEYSVDQQLASQIRVPEVESDPCPMCGADVGRSGLLVRRSPMAFMLKHGYYRRCPGCHKERQVAI